VACNNANCLSVLQAKELGVRSVIIDGPDSWCQTLQDDNMIEKFIGIDFSDAESVFDKCLAACKKVQKVCSLSLFVCILCVYSFHWPHPPQQSSLSQKVSIHALTPLPSARMQRRKGINARKRM